MQNKKIKKLIIGLLIFGQVITLPGLAFAQFSVPTSDANNGNVPGGLTGNGVNISFQGALAPITTANQTCSTAEAAYEKTDSAAQVGFSGLSIIGGDSVLLTQLAAKITAYNGFITCRKAVLVSLNALVAPSTFTSSIKQQQITLVSGAIDTYTSKLEQVQARYNNAKQGFWKTFMFNILIKTSKSVVNTLVGKLVNSYKINNIKQYADSVATLMYDNQFIRDNFPNAQTQLMARAIMENPKFRYKVPAGVFIAADQALGFNPKDLDLNGPQFYTNMAEVGSSSANPFFQHSQYVGGVDQARALSLAYSQNQISQSNGYKAPVTCAGSLAQQQAIDGQTKAADDRLANRKALLKDLQDYRDSNKNLSAAETERINREIAKAQADYDSALNAWSNLPYTVTGQNSKAGATTTSEGTMAIKICEAISSPAVLVNQGIDAAFKSVGVNLGQYDNNNLPGFIKIIGDVAAQIGSSLVLGGTGAAAGAALINEGKLVNAAIGAAGEYAASQASANLATKGITTFSIERNPGASSANSYSVNWEINKDIITSANFVTISGNGISAITTDPRTGQTVPNKLPLSGAYNITTTVGGSYFITIFDVTGRAITSGTLNLDTRTNPQAYNYNPNASAVAGAYTQKTSLGIRGPTVTLSPRGTE